MKKKLFFIAGVLFLSANVRADEDPIARAHKSLKDQVFVVETDSDSASDSLNRISGHIDTGFSSFDQSFESSDHYRSGPFAQQEAKDEQS